MAFNIKKDRQNTTPKSNKTIEQMYDEKIEYFDMLQNSLSNRIQALNEFSSKDLFCDNCLTLFPSSKKSCSLCGETCKIKLYDTSRLSQKISDIEGKKEENEYFLNSHKILLNYHTADVSPQIASFETKNKTNKRQEIIMEYYKANDKTFVKKKNSPSLVSYCKECNIEIKETKEKDFVCTGCGVVYEKIIDGFSYKDFENYSSISVSFDYQRINYFTEWLNHIQAKEDISLGQELLNSIKLELQKERITDSSKITHPKMKKILKFLKEPKLYDHIPAIISKICGVQPLAMPPEVINKLKEMFMIIQEPFEIFKGERKNFFSYPYVIYKFCELLGLHEYLVHFQLLKSREKLLKQDILWKKIILFVSKSNINSGVHWKFIASC